ncbi:hypothetical protein KUTeg_010211 [Tegillarca granosa]|uniref:Leucine-rich repeat and WD repeat-containing protein 1 n=1 Tax=Tegillarca granosa TaxID=220873 RepID=A0ABQ9FB21_TEGGR|nr:hypothetical protein KUTeg_010211 [Tegillarca granosa]
MDDRMVKRKQEYMIPTDKMESMSCNRVTEELILKEGRNELKKITCLSLCDQGITDLDATVMNKLTSLKTLDLSANNITEIPEDLSLRQLTTLGLADNLLTSVSFIEYFPKLTRLEIFGNPLFGVAEKCIAIDLCKSLREVDDCKRSYLENIINSSRNKWETQPVIPDYDPSFFVRCHSKDNSPTDDTTKIWQCSFEPVINLSDCRENIVATCGGNVVCLVDCQTGKVMKKYKDNREVVPEMVQFMFGILAFLISQITPPNISKDPDVKFILPTLDEEEMRDEDDDEHNQVVDSLLVLANDTVDTVAVGDDNGNIHMYNMEDLTKKKSVKSDTILEPSRVLEWPDLSNEFSRESSPDNQNIVINCVCISANQKYIVCGTDNNLVCIWKKC